MVICPKVNKIAGLEFELAYNDVVKQHVNQCATGSPPENEPDCINFLLAWTPAGFLAGQSGIRVGRSIIQQRQT